MKKIRDLRKLNGKTARAAHETSLYASAVEMEVFLSEQFPELTPINNDELTKVLNVTTFGQLVKALTARYPGVSEFDIVAIANSAYQKTDFNPSKMAREAPSKMIAVWNTYFRNATTVGAMRAYENVLRDALFNVANYTLIEACVYGHPSPRDNVTNEAAGSVAPHSVVDCIHSAECSVLLNTFLNFKHDVKAADEDVISARDYLNGIVDGAPHPYRFLSAWWDGPLPTEKTRWTIRRGRKVPNPEIFTQAKTCPCVIPEYMDSVPPRFATMLHILLDTEAGTSTAEQSEIVVDTAAVPTQAVGAILEVSDQ